MKLSALRRAAYLFSLIFIGANFALADGTWGNLYHGPWTEWYTGTSIRDFVVNPDGGATLVGTSNGHGIVMRVDSTGAVLWSRVFKGGGYQRDTDFTGVTRLADNGFAVIGSAKPEGGIGGWDILVVRLGSDGNVAWQRLYGRANTEDGGQRIYENIDNTLVATGRVYYAGVPGCPYSGYEAAFIQKIAANGSPISDYILAGDGSDHQVYRTNDEGYLVSLSRSLGAPYWVTSTNLQKYTAAGALTWSKVYFENLNAAHPYIGISDVFLLDVGNGFVVTGPTYYVDNDTGYSALSAFKVSYAGVPIWRNRIVISGYNGTHWANQMTKTSDEGTIQSINSSYSTSDIVLIKLDGNGRVALSNTFTKPSGGGPFVPLTRSVGAGYFTVANGFDFLLARLNSGAALDLECLTLPTRSQPYVEQATAGINVGDGGGASSCNQYVAHSTSITIDLLEAGGYKKVNACVPQMDVAATLEFYSQNVGTSSSAKRLNVSNYYGLSPLIVEGVALQDPTHFTVVADTCSMARVPSQGSCYTDVVFNPKSGGALATNLVFSTNDPDTAGVVQVRGTAVGTPSPTVTPSPTASPIPTISPTPTSAPKQPDIVASKLKIPTKVQRGGKTSVAVQLNNAGEASAGSFKVKVYLSTNNKFDTKDRLLGSFTISKLAIEAVLKKTLTVKIPKNVKQGKYYVIAIIDASKLIFEVGDHGNVVVSGKVTVK